MKGNMKKNKRSKRVKKGRPQQQQQIQLGPEDALKMLDQVCANYQGKREEHQLLGHSLSVLEAVTKEWRQLKSESEEAALSVVPDDEDDEDEDEDEDEASA